ncbi:hypothetical protein [Portibacter lacus]|nr:hypothetical protein [Portibacter lacus]
MKNAIVLFLLTLFLLSCSKREDRVVNCANYKTALLSFDSDLLVAEMDKLTEDLLPVPIESDELGHHQNLKTLVSKLNSSCSEVSAEIKCYACVKTLPTQSEIKVELDSLGTEVVRVIDISTPENDPLQTLGAHYL